MHLVAEVLFIYLYVHKTYVFLGYSENSPFTSENGCVVVVNNVGSTYFNYPSV